jgi:hypothetical protein
MNVQFNRAKSHFNMRGTPCASPGLGRTNVLDSWIKATTETLEQFLDGPDVSGAARYAEQIGLTPQLGIEALEIIIRSRSIPLRWQALWDQLGDDEPLLGRWLLAHGALETLDKIRQLPVVAEVGRLICSHHRRIAQLALGNDAIYRPRSREFREMAEVALLRRFIAGQLHWNISGITRSRVFQMSWGDATRTMATVAQAGGWFPYFEAHLSARGAPLLIEAEYKRCYLRMAQSMELQPGIRGVMGTSWLHAEETIRISPHLEWLNTLFLDNGGVVVHVGPASEDSGFLVGSNQRRQFYETGAYKPRNAMFVWPREAFLNWAREEVRSQQGRGIAKATSASVSH